MPLPRDPHIGLTECTDPWDFGLVPERFVVQAGGREAILTPTQFRILAMLVAEPDRVFGRTELVDRGIGTLVTERTVDAHIKEVRRRLGPIGTLIETVRGVGYRFRGRHAAKEDALRPEPSE